jgi:hypothetical protein
MSSIEQTTTKSASLGTWFLSPRYKFVAILVAGFGDKKTKHPHKKHPIKNISKLYKKNRHFPKKYPQLDGICGYFLFWF